MRSPGKRYRHLKRYQEIARALIRHGFGGLVDQLGLLPALSLPRRLLHREAEAPSLSPPEHLRLAIEELGPPSSNWASLIVGMALLIPLVAGGGQGFVFWLVVAGFAAASFMGLGLLYSIWRAERRGR
ncbi:MAG: hypothetical protein H8E47_02205 [Anaerolineales bacterium]|nr:hypothetical protein [Anaerolineales bacterium]